MKLLSLLTVAIVLIGITTQAFACNYERMSHIPNYAKITMPKKILNIPNAHGIRVAPNGNFAVMSTFNTKKIYIYYSCGKLMKEVDLSKHIIRKGHDCAFTDRSLYVTDTHGKVYELSTTGKFIRIFATGLPFDRITSCQDRIYVTTGHRKQNFYVYDTNGKLIRHISLPAAGGVTVGIDGNLYVSNMNRKQVYTFTPEGRQVDVRTYREIHRGDGLAMDTAGNLLIADFDRGKVEVYSPCGVQIKTIRTGTRYAADVKIGNDGTVMVADYVASKVFLY